MRKFIDLHLQVPLDDSESAGKMLTKASELGYDGVGIPLPHNVSDVTFSKLRQVCTEAGIDFIFRLDLAPRNSNDLLFQLRRNRRRFEIIAVQCFSKAVARQAAKDRRVDLLSFPSLDFRNRFFDRSEAELASNALSGLEVDMAVLLSATSFDRTRLLSYIRREIATAERFHVPVVVSSGAKNELFMRKPQDFAALAHLFDITRSSAIKAVSENPLDIINRNRMKLLSSFVAPGIRIVRRGKDC